MKYSAMSSDILHVDSVTGCGEFALVLFVKISFDAGVFLLKDASIASTFWFWNIKSGLSG